MHVPHRPKSGRHPEKTLSALQVRNLTKPGRYHDGNGLYLVVSETGGKRWILRTVVDGRRRDIGLGGITLVSLAEARDKATEFRKLARAGGDPQAERRRERQGEMKFSDAAVKVHAERKAAWRNAKHGQQWINTLTQYAVPMLGDLSVDRIETPDIMRVLSPIWLEKPETARRVRQRLKTVFDWAKASGYRSGENPVEGVSKGLPRQGDKDVHHAALPYAKVPEFVARLRKEGRGELSRLAFEFLILTASRTGEVRGMLKSEVTTDDRLWSIPAERMKAKVQHRVPLSNRCMAILKRATELAPNSRYVFPNTKSDSDEPISNMVFAMMLRRMEVPVTTHGFRSSFRDWVSETASFSGELAEMALAHTIKNKVEAAYRRGDLLEQRRALMESWARYASQAEASEIR